LMSLGSEPKKVTL